MIQLICDLCGKPLNRSAIGAPGIRRFRVQEKRWIPIFGNWGDWQELECHEECLAALLNGFKNAKETKNESE